MAKIIYVVIDYDDNNTIMYAYSNHKKMMQGFKKLAKDNDMSINRIQDRFGFEKVKLY